MPPGLTVASYAVDGVSYVGTGKSLTDHMLSDMAGRDCATWRLLKSRPICRDFTPDEIARRKQNKDEIRHNVGHAYIATNLDGIDLDDGAGLANTPKGRPAGTPGDGANTVAPAAGGKPVILEPAPVKREDLGPAPGAAGKPIVRRHAKPAPLRRVRVERPAGDRYLVFGSFRHRTEAARFAGRHAVMQPMIVPAKVRGRRYYRVVVRPDGREALATARSKLRRGGITDAYTMRICRRGVRSSHCMKPTPTTHQGGRPAVRPVTGGG